MRFQQIAGFPCPKIGIHEIQVDHPDMGLRPPASQRQVDGDFRLATAVIADNYDNALELNSQRGSHVRIHHLPGMKPPKIRPAWRF
jgi:hypothetical protein